MIKIKMDWISKLAGVCLLAFSVWLALNWIPGAQGDMRAEEAVALIGIEGVHKQLLQQGDKTSKLAKYCKGKLQIADKSFKLLREDGWTIDETIADLQLSRKQLKEQKGETIPQHIYVEYERMTRIIDRHSDKSTESLRKRFYGECLALGF